MKPKENRKYYRKYCNNFAVNSREFLEWLLLLVSKLIGWTLDKKSRFEPHLAKDWNARLLVLVYVKFLVGPMLSTVPLKLHFWWYQNEGSSTRRKSKL